MATLEERIQALELKMGTQTPVRFPQGMSKVAVLNLLDKVLVGVNADGSAKVADVNQLSNLISAAVGSGIEPTVEPSTTLPTPAQAGKIMIMKGGSYTQPGGGTLVAPANSFNVGYWDGNQWRIDISIETEADLSGFATATALETAVTSITGEYTIGDKDYGSVTMVPGGSFAVRAFATPLPDDIVAKELKCYAAVEGDIRVNVYTVSGGTATLIRAETVTLSLGNNSIALTGWAIPKGAIWGFEINSTTLLGRVGYMGGTTYVYPTYNMATGTTASIGTATTTNRWGIQLIGVSTTNIERLKTSPDVGDLYFSEFFSQVNTPTLTKSNGVLTVEFTAGNQNIAINYPALENEFYWVKFRSKVVAGGSIKLLIGQFSSNNVGARNTTIVATSDEREFIVAIQGPVTRSIAIGVLSGDNNGATIEVRDFAVYRIENTAAAALSKASMTGMPTHFNTESVFASLSKTEKPLTRIVVLGDSLMANAIGGDVPPEIYEGEINSPIRMKYNNIARRLYDKLAWNKATWRRLDSPNWIKNGTWTSVNNTSIFEPIYSTERYHVNSEANSYIEITVPNGMENFALVYQERNGAAAMTVTLNGGNISAHGPTPLNPNVALAGTGNPYATAEYVGLPVGNNVIRITRDDTANQCRIWGGFYWTGNTLMVINAGHGGHTLTQLLAEHVDAEVLRNKPDAILFELTLMNDAARAVDSDNTIDKSKAALELILDKLKGKDMLVMSTNPYGTDPRDGTPNFFEQYPGLLEMRDALKSVVYKHGLAFFDVLEVFARMVINRGGTLEDGDAGLWYTWDGQHGNEVGVSEWWRMIDKLLDIG